MQPYGPVAGSGDFVSFEVQEFVAGHVVRQDIAAFCFQHGREYDAVEHDIVFSDKMDQTGFGIFPPCLPAVRKKFFRVGDVADRRVEPNVEHFSFCAFHGNRDTPVEVTAYGAWLQPHVEPAFALSVHVRAPFFMVFQNPFAQPAFVLVEGEIPVFGFFHHRFAAANGAFRVDKVCR